ncbi:MAG: hypothetical protein IPK19_10770 [Chloroflexi bacterium]|nr:hypothetical protein [Chloroflexota bacterium]
MNRTYRVLFCLSFAILFAGDIHAQIDPQVCEPIWQQVLAAVSEAGCREFENEHACYGHSSLSVTYRDDVPEEAIEDFSSPGDRSPLEIIEALYTSQLDPQNEAYGVGVLRFAAVVPADMNAYLAGTRPGDTVQFILYGDAFLRPELDAPRSRDRDVRTMPQLPGFYFYTGVSPQPICIDIPEGALPEGGLLVQSPQGIQVEFNANGASIRIGSSVLLQAQPDQVMSVSVLQGSARVEVPGYPAVELARLQKTTVPLGGLNGLEAAGEPTAPVGIDVHPWGLLGICQLADLGGLYDPCGGVPPTAVPRITVTREPTQPRTVCQVQRSGDRINLRSGPGTGYRITSGMDSGDRRQAVGQFIDSRGQTWYKLSGSGENWVLASLVTTLSGCNLPLPQATVGNLPDAPNEEGPGSSPDAATDIPGITTYAAYQRFQGWIWYLA